MIIVMSPSATKEDVKAVRKKAEDLGYVPSVSKGMEKTVISLIGTYPEYDLQDLFSAMKGVEEVIPILKPYRLVSRHHKKENTIVTINGVKIGGRKIVIMAGPSSVERKDQLLLAAFGVKEAGAKVLRGGTYKVRLRSWEKPGLGREGLKILKEVKKETNLLIITEVRNPREVKTVSNYADILQIGTLYMHNLELLASAADSKKPILLKRGMMASIEEWLLCAEYILKRGNPNVILCERGIRTFEKYTPYTLDLSAIPVVKNISHLPIIVDPSHGTGCAKYVPAMAKAAIAAGADGLLIEVHPNPSMAISGGIRQMDIQSFKELMEDLKEIAKAVGRSI